jgi:hypothetical protein
MRIMDLAAHRRRISLRKGGIKMRGGLVVLRVVSDGKGQLESLGRQDRGPNPTEVCSPIRFSFSAQYPEM